jgi:hypothetical protein
MIEQFSSSYYRAEMDVQPLEGGPTIEGGLYDLLDQRVYNATDAPVTMRLGLSSGPRFSPDRDMAMPTNVIGVPQDILRANDIHPSAENVNVFILKPKEAYLFNTITNG